MGLFSRFFNKEPTTNKVELVTERGNGFYSWNGRLYQSDVVRACIRPKAKAIGKLTPKHIRRGKEGLETNPDPYLRFLLEEPNPLMTGQMLQEKLATQLMLNSNAFALIVRDDFGLPMQIYPITCTSAEAKYSNSGELMLKFMLINGKSLTFWYRDIIHLRRDFNENDIFGESPVQTLTSLMEVVNATDQSIVKAIKNSNVIRWLLKYQSSMRPEDLERNVQMFVDNFLSSESKTVGAAGTDTSFDAKQVEPTSFVPKASQMDRSTTRIYNFFNTNIDIVQSKYDEDKWNAYYESEVEPDAKQLSEEYTRKVFSRKQRGFGNKIIFEASSLQYASMDTKLRLREMVDRGAMTPDEWRKILNLGPIEGGDKPIRRLDTAVVTEEDNNNANESTD